ncbi:hypothetical protein BWD42_07685 [Sphingobacterium sp. CZ-UAM]|uniref:CPBP family intramembrane glutamic endopeptidase n=1 Tax=Sphingobacterium sp. CZ-UAM TaxID=1933868 RepID=UPI0009851148|nr:type II CAAX endopeptidase family protein [Sphingobacterium sp. CZ-UAM]OOG19772.1 hypothetical protein BWD42_07685 [Sphingobacterium sp. CZ-UAM]
MRFPTLFQSFFILAVLFVVQMLFNSIINLPNYKSLEDLLTYAIPAVVFLCGLKWLEKKEYIFIDPITAKKVNMINLAVSILITLLIFLNQGLDLFSFFSQGNMGKTAESILKIPADKFVFLKMVVAAPIFEEILFRGLIFKGIQSNYSTKVGLFVSSLLFGIFHLDIVGSTLLAFFWCWLYYKTDNILFCIVCHAICNLVGFLLRLYIKAGNDISFLEDYSNHKIVISIIMSSASVFMLVILVKRLSIHKNSIKSITYNR